MDPDLYSSQSTRMIRWESMDLHLMMSWQFSWEFVSDSWSVNLIPSHTLNNIFAVFPPVKIKLLCKDLIYKGGLNSSQADLFFISVFHCITRYTLWCELHDIPIEGIKRSVPWQSGHLTVHPDGRTVNWPCCLRTSLSISCNAWELPYRKMSHPA